MDWTAHVIHIRDRCPERLDKLRQHMQLHPDIKWEVFDAVYLPSNPVEGCARSHLKNVQEAKERGEPFRVVFEDDIEPTSHFSKAAIDRCIQFMQERKLDLFLGGIAMVDQKQARWLANIDIDIEIQSDGGSKSRNLDLMQLGDFCSLHLVVYNQSSYDKLLGHWQSKDSHIDRWMGSARMAHLTKFTAVPFLAMQAAGHSVLRNMRVQYHDLYGSKEKALMSLIPREQKQVQLYHQHQPNPPISAANIYNGNTEKKQHDENKRLSPTLMKVEERQEQQQHKLSTSACVTMLPDGTAEVWIPKHATCVIINLV